MNNVTITPAAPPGQPILPPGFRFHPTDEELVVYYLKRKATSCPLPVPIITDVHLYKFDPWELPGKALYGEHEWYFFSPRDRKYPNGDRPNRAASSGYWKATGTDKPITSSLGVNHGQVKVGVKKALVFYKGRPPKGEKTNWIMHEYCLTSDQCTPELRPSVSFSSRKSLRLDDWVLCRIYKKNSHDANTTIKTCESKESDEQSSSCVEEVPASLSCAPDPKLGTLPKLGSFGILQDRDLFIDNILSDPQYSPVASTHQQHENYGSGTMLGCARNFPVMSGRHGTFPCSYTTIPKVECIDIKTASCSAKGSLDFCCSSDDHSFGKGNLSSLSNLTYQKTHANQHKRTLQLSTEDLDSFYRWPLVARVN